jgi:hypothetical protein
MPFARRGTCISMATIGEATENGDAERLMCTVKEAPEAVVTQFEIGAHVLTVGCPLHTQAMRPLQAMRFKLSHRP